MLTLFFIAAFFATCSAVWLIRAWARRNLLDVPNERSSHTLPTPRGGGAGIFAVFILFFLNGLYFNNSISIEKVIFVCAAACIALISLIDDLYSLSNKLRFSVHILAALAIVYCFFQYKIIQTTITPISILFAAAAVFWIVGLTNAYNFMDGIDGIAALQGIVAGILWIIYGNLTNENVFILSGGLLTASCSGFYLFNRQPATIFMGDVGSAFLGFVCAALPFLADKAKAEHFVFAAIFVLPFLLDTFSTLLRRAYQRENIFQAHRTHFYQKLVVKGFEHRQVSIVYALSAFILGIGTIFVYQNLWQK